MGCPKAWLHYQQETFLERLIRISTQAQASEVLVVVGAKEDSAQNPGLLSQTAVQSKLPAATLKQIKICIGSPDQSPIDSIRHGLLQLSAPTRLLLWPIDCPFASQELVIAMSQSFKSNENKIARPLINNAHGHPVLFGTQAAQELLGPLAEHGARGVVRHDPSRLIDLPSSESKILANLNTPGEARELGVVLP